MSTLDEVRARQAAELRVLELEDALTAAKGDPDVQGVDVPDDEYRQLKVDLREARREWRSYREAEAGQVAEDGADAVASPATVESAVTDGREG